MGFRTPTGVVDSEAKGGAFSSGIQDATSPNFGEPGPQGPQGEMGNTGATGSGLTVIASATATTEGGLEGFRVNWDFEPVSSGTTIAPEDVSFFIPNGEDGMNGAAGRSIVSGSVTDGTLTLVDSNDDDIVVTGNVTGDAGAQGPIGHQGKYDVRLFTAAATEPDSPVGLIWTASTNTLTGTNTDSWSLNPPDTPVGQELWEVIATFDPAGVNTTITSWGNVFQAGGEGPAGPAGPIPDFTFDANTIPNNQDAFISPVSGDGSADDPYILTFNLPRGNPGSNGLNGQPGLDGNNGTSVTNIFFNTAVVTDPYDADADTITFELTDYLTNIVYITFANPFVSHPVRYGSANTIITELVFTGSISADPPTSTGVLTVNGTDTNHTNIMFQNESDPVVISADVDTLNFIGEGVNVTMGATGIANITITGGSSSGGSHTFNPTVTWDAVLKDYEFSSSPVLSGTAMYSAVISNIDPDIFTVTNTTFTGVDSTQGTYPNFSVSLGTGFTAAPGVYTISATIMATDDIDGGTDMATRSITFEIYLPLYYGVAPAGTTPDPVSLAGKEKFNGSEQMSFSGAGAAYVALPNTFITPVFKSGILILETDGGTTSGNWTVYKLTDYDETGVGTFIVDLTATRA